jgi:hypothetical protein
MNKYDLINKSIQFIKIGKNNFLNPIYELQKYIYKGSDDINYNFDMIPNNMKDSCLNEINIFEGPSDIFYYERHNKIYILLQETLQQFNTKLSYSWATCAKKTIIVSKSDDNIFVWNVGQTNSNPNKLYVNGKIIKVSLWLKITDEERLKIYDKYKNK